MELHIEPSTNWRSVWAARKAKAGQGQEGERSGGGTGFGWMLGSIWMGHVSEKVRFGHVYIIAACVIDGRKQGRGPNTSLTILDIPNYT